MVLQFPSLSCILAIHTASTARVAELLPDPRLRPVTVMPGRCLFVVAGLQYRRSDLGPYDELALSVPIAFGARPVPLLDTVRDVLAQAFNAWVWRLPVSTEAACRGGIEWASFPKEVADVRFACDEREARCTLHEDGAPSVTLACAATAHAGDRQVELRPHTLRDGAVLVAPFVLRQTRWRDELLRDAVDLRLGEGALARAVRRLELSARPVASHWCAQAQGTLHAARGAK